MKKQIYQTYFLTLILSVLLLAGSEIYSQKNYDFERFVREGGDLLERPIKWGAGDWLKAGGIIAGSFAAMHIDESVRSFMLRNRGYENSTPMVFGTLYGEPLTSAGLGTIFLVHGLAADNKANEKFGFEIWQSFVYTGLFTTLVKYLAGRERPSSAKSAFEFHPLSFKNDSFLSFFSGHTSVAFSLSTVIAGNVDGTGWKILSYVPAFVTGFSRIYHNKHWTSDVLMGAAIGYFIGKFVTDRHEIEETNNESLIQQQQQLLNFRMAF